MHELTVVIAHHNVDELTEHHTELVRKNNPGTKVLLVSSGEQKFSTGNSYFAHELGPIGHLWGQLTQNGRDKGKAWGSADLVFLAANFLDIKTQRWILLEYDARCNASLKRVYEPSWNCDVGGSCIKIWPDDWAHWRNMSAPMNSVACGIIPMNGVFLSGMAMKHMASEVLHRTELHPVFSELRFGTLARYLGYTPIKVNSGNNSSMPRSVYPNSMQKGFWHPVKHII